MDAIKDPKSYQIIGACMEVHRELGAGFVEKVYQDALEVEFQKRGIKYEREKVCQICYKGITLNHTFQPDFICFDGYIVELKAMSEIDNIARAQTINYMHATKMKNALLINFGEASLKFERFIN